jgi:hypothetical protein
MKLPHIPLALAFLSSLLCEARAAGGVNWPQFRGRKRAVFQAQLP